MEQLRRVLGQEENALVSVLVNRADFDPETARRFVSEAGDDLVETFRWQAADVKLDDASARRHARHLLGFIHADAIAARVGITSRQAWRGLRALVPSVLWLATGATDRRRSA